MTAKVNARNVPVQQRGKATLERLIAAGHQVLVDVRRDRLTTAMVADRAGVSIGTFYRYFKDDVMLLEQIDPCPPPYADAQLRALHTKVAHKLAPEPFCGHCSHHRAPGDTVPWPCPTINILDGGRIVNPESTEG